jgi:hypothetical protein
MVFYNLFPMEKVDFMDPKGDRFDDTCMWDFTFIVSQDWNDYLAKHPILRDKLMMYSSFLMDFVQLMGFIMFWLRCDTTRPVIAFILFFI